MLNPPLPPDIVAMAGIGRNRRRHGRAAASSAPPIAMEYPLERLDAIEESARLHQWR